MFCWWLSLSLVGYEKRVSLSKGVNIIKHRAETLELIQQPTQARHPWRATARTVIAALIALLPALPEIASTLEISTVPIIASILAITALVTRVLAIPEVDKWVDRFMPALSADNGYIENKDDSNGYT